MSRTLRIGLVGGDAVLGRVPAGDIARLLLGIERVVARASGEVRGRRLKSRGRWTTIAENTARFRLVGIEAGSVVAVMELPAEVEEPDRLDFEFELLGELALSAALGVLNGIHAGYTDTARAFLRMASDVGLGLRYEAIRLEQTRDGQEVTGLLNERVRRDLENVAAAAQAQPQADLVTGVLVEADFESNTARLRDRSNASVAVTFEPELADSIQEALRRPTSLVGEVTYDETEGRAVSVRLREISPATQLVLQARSEQFWDNPSLEELGRMQGVKAIASFAALRDPEASEGEIDAFLAALLLPTFEPASLLAVCHPAAS